MNETVNLSDYTCNNVQYSSVIILTSLLQRKKS